MLNNMTSRSLLSLSIKILGLFLIVHFIKSLKELNVDWIFNPQVIGKVQDKVFLTLFEFIAQIFQLLVAFVFLWRSDTIVKILRIEDTEISTLYSENYERQMFMLALRIIGINFIVNAVYNSIEPLFWWVSKVTISRISPSYYLIKSAGCFVVGLYLILGDSRLAKLIYKGVQDK